MNWNIKIKQIANTSSKHCIALLGYLCNKKQFQCKVDFAAGLVLQYNQQFHTRYSHTYDSFYQDAAYNVEQIQTKHARYKAYCPLVILPCCSRLMSEASRLTASARCWRCVISLPTACNCLLTSSMAGCNYRNIEKTKIRRTICFRKTIKPKCN
jgi:hypothetical protein